MPDYVKFPLVLLLVTLISATALALVWDIAAPRIEQKNLEKERAAERLVFPEGELGEAKEAVVESGGRSRQVRYKEVRRGGDAIGYVAKGSATGYSSTIEVLVGMTRDFTVKGVKILSQQETPGLGTRVEEVKSDRTWCAIIAGKKRLGAQPGEEEPLPWFPPKFVGLTADQARLKVDGGEVDGITGATISSRAVSDAVRGAIESVRLAVGAAR